MAAGINIFTLLGSILVDSDQANKSISKTEKNAESLGSKLGKGIGTAAKFGAGLAAGAAVGAAALFGVAKKSADATDRIDKMSQKLGLSRKGFQEWDYVLSQNGISIDSMQGGLKTLTNKFDDLSNGSKGATEQFEAIGLSMEDLKGKSQEEIFAMTIEGLQGLEDETKRAAIANDLLGRSGSELAPLLNAGAESVEALKKNANDLGLVLGDSAIDSGVLFTDTMDNIKRSLAAAATGIGAELMPMVQVLLDWVMAHMPEIQNFIKIAFAVIRKAVSLAIDIFRDYLLPVLTDLFEWIKENMPEIKEFIKTTFENIVLFVKLAILVFKEYLLPILVTLFNWISENMPTIKKTFKTVFDAIVVLVETVWEIFSKVLLPILKVIFEWVSDNWPTIQKVFETVFKAIGVVIDLAIEGFQKTLEIFTAVFNFVRDVFSGIGELIKSAFDGVIGFIDGIVDKFNKVKDAISGAINKVKEFVGVDKDVKYEPDNPDDFYKPKRPSNNSYFDGSHADGLAYVPYDGYVAELHKGERVLTAEENKGSGRSIVNDFSNMTMVVREEADIKRIARELFNLQKSNDRGLGFA